MRMTEVGFWVLVLTVRTASSAAPAAATLGFNDLFRSHDRVVFVGDELTQQMSYSCAVATAVAALIPEGNLHFYSAGREGATAEDAQLWVNDVLELTKPTVTLVCFGINDAKVRGSEDVVAGYRRHLCRLVDGLQAFQSVRQVVILAPPATHPGSDDGQHAIRHRLAMQASELAEDRDLPFVNLFDTLDQIYQSMDLATAPILTRGGRPTEEAHMIMASIVLLGLGVDPVRLNALGWSPMSPQRMGRIRPLLPLLLTAPDLNRAQSSRGIYLRIRQLDELFFRLWRLSSREPDGNPAGELQSRIQADWAALHSLLRSRFVRR